MQGILWPCVMLEVPETPLNIRHDFDGLVREFQYAFLLEEAVFRRV